MLSLSAPALSIRSTWPRVRLAWATKAVGCVLESTPALDGAGWRAVTNTVQIVAEQYEAETDARDETQFYRLRQR